MAQQLHAFLEKENCLGPFKSRFWLHHGTETALVTVHNGLLRETDMGGMTVLILLEVSANFDAVNHGIFLERLSGVGIGGLEVSWS